MTKNVKYAETAEKIRDLFQKNLGEFRSENFVEVADLMGFHAVEKHKSEAPLKPCGENYLPDIISTNLQYALDAYEWKTHVPMTEDGVIVSDFWDREKEEKPPAGYEMEAGGRFLERAEG
jgi:hypothetical protein